MTKYYLDVRTGTNVLRDCDGAEFTGLDAVEEEARISVLEIAQHRLSGREDAVSIEVRDDAGEPVITVTASIAVSRAR